METMTTWQDLRVIDDKKKEMLPKYTKVYRLVQAFSKWAYVLWVRSSILQLGLRKDPYYDFRHLICGFREANEQE